MSNYCQECPLGRNDVPSMEPECPGPVWFIPGVTELSTLNPERAPTLRAQRVGMSVLQPICNRDVDITDPHIIVTDPTAASSRYGMRVSEKIARLDDATKRRIGEECRDDYQGRLGDSIAAPPVAPRRPNLTEVKGSPAISPNVQLWAEFHAIATELEIPSRIKNGDSVIEEARDIFGAALRGSQYRDSILSFFDEAQNEQRRVLGLEGEFKEKVFQYLRENQIAPDITGAPTTMGGLNEWVKDHPALPELELNGVAYMNQVLRQLVVACEGLSHGGFRHLQETILGQRRWWFSEVTKNSGNMLAFDAQAILSAQQRQAKVAQEKVYGIFGKAEELIDMWSRL